MYKTLVNHHCLSYILYEQGNSQLVSREKYSFIYSLEFH